MQAKVLTASGVLTAARAKLTGYSIGAGGSAVIVNFRETNVSGRILVQVKIAANDSKNEVFRDGIEFNDVIFVEFATGTPSNLAVFWE